MNISHEDDPLKPYTQPTPDFSDERRLGKNNLYFLKWMANCIHI